MRLDYFIEYTWSVPRHPFMKIWTHAWDATAVWYKRYVGYCRDNDQGNRCVYTVTASPQGLHYWSLEPLRNSESNKIRSCPFCCWIATPVSNCLLGIHALTRCDTILSFSGKGNNTCWKFFIMYTNLLTGVAIDDSIDDAWASVCSLYGIGEQNGRGIVKVKRDLEVLLPTHGALELQIIKAN